jgi:hypothetical protein
MSAAAVKVDITMEDNAAAAAAAAAAAKKRKIDDDAAEFSDAQDAQGPTPTQTLTPTTPTSRGPVSTTTSSSIGGSASQVQAAEDFAKAPPGGHNFDSIAKMIGVTMSASMQTNLKVEENTNTTNTSAALIKNVGKKVDTLEGKLEKMNKRLSAVEGGAAKGSSKGSAKKPAVFNMSPRGPDPLQTDDPWTNGRVNRAAGLGFVPEPRQDQETNDEWATYANNTAARGRTSEFTLAPRPGDRTGLIFGGFQTDTDREDIEACLRKIVLGVEGVESIKSLGKFGIAGKVTFDNNNLMWDFIKAHNGG